MKIMQKVAAVVTLWFTVTSLAVMAAESGSPSESGTQTPPAGGGVTSQGDSGGIASGTGLSEEIKDAIKQFQAARDEYLKARAELRKGLLAASADERAKIREQLKALVREWVKDQKQYRDRIREELREMRENLHNARDKQLEEVKGESDGKRGKGR